MHSATKELLHHRPPSRHQQSAAGRQYETITEVNNITWNTIDRLENTKPISLVVAVLTTDTKSILALCLSCRCGRIHLNSQTHILRGSIHMFYSKKSFVVSILPILRQQALKSVLSQNSRVEWVFFQVESLVGVRCEVWKCCDAFNAFHYETNCLETICLFIVLFKYLFIGC